MRKSLKIKITEIRLQCSDVSSKVLVTVIVMAMALPFYEEVDTVTVIHSLPFYEEVDTVTVIHSLPFYEEVDTVTVIHSLPFYEEVDTVTVIHSLPFYEEVDTVTVIHALAVLGNGQFAFACTLVTDSILIHKHVFMKSKLTFGLSRPAVYLCINAPCHAAPSTPSVLQGGTQFTHSCLGKYGMINYSVSKKIVSFFSIEDDPP